MVLMFPSAILRSERNRNNKIFIYLDNSLYKIAMWSYLEYFYEKVYFPIGQFIDVTTNYIVVAVGVFVFVKFAYLPVIFPLRKVFAKQGLTFGESFRLVFTFGKKAYDKIRVYMELACIQNNTSHLSREEWKKLRYRYNELIKNYPNDPAKACIRVDTCSDLLHEQVKLNISRYFRFMNNTLHPEESRAEHATGIADVYLRIGRRWNFRFNKWWYKHYAHHYGMNANASTSFLPSIEIKEGFLAPMAVITGLNDRFEQNWKQILDRYNSALNIERVLPEELFFSFNWLMWGPSYRIDYDPEEKDKACILLYGYGDEANSVNVLMRMRRIIEEKGKDILQELDLSNDQPGEFGKYGTIAGKLTDTRRFCQLNRGIIETNSKPFLERISQEALSTPFVLDIKSFTPVDICHRERNIPFFSAYLWIMFQSEDADPSFSPAKSVTFFEHSNLPNPGNYKFLAECLIEKAFGYLRKIEGDDRLRSRSYRYCLATNKYIESLFRKKLEKYKAETGSFSSWLTGHVYPEPKVDIITVLDAFDRYFLTTRIRRLTDTEADRMILSEFYVRSYHPHFKSTNNYRTFDHMLQKLSGDVTDGCLYAEFDHRDQIIALTSVTYLREKRFYLIESCTPGQHFGSSEKKLTEQAGHWIERQDTDQNSPKRILWKIPRLNRKPDEISACCINQGFDPFPSSAPNDPVLWFVSTDSTFEKTEIQAIINELG